MMPWSNHLVIIVLSLFNTLLHGVGCTLLIRVYKNGKKTIQLMYLINLGMCECILNVIRSLQHIMILADTNPPTPQIAVINMYLNFFAGSGLFYLYSLAMFYITGHRLLSILLPFKYHVIWTLHRTKLLLVATWSINVTLAFAVIIGVYLLELDTNNVQNKRGFTILYLYIPTAFNVIFLLFALFSYSIMFQRFSHSRRRFSQACVANNCHKQTLLQIFRHSKFFVSILVITSFLLLMVIPSLIHSLSKMSGYDMPQKVVFFTFISVTLSDTADGLIYIFLQKSVRSLLFSESGVKFPSFELNVRKMSLIMKRHTVIQEDCSDDLATHV